MGTPETYAHLTRQLDDVRQLWRARNLRGGTLLTLACVLAAALVLVAADNLIKPGTMGRLFMAVAF